MGEVEFKFSISGNVDREKLFISCKGVVEGYDSFKEFKRRIFEVANVSQLEHIRNVSFKEMDIKFVDSHPLSNEVIGFMLKLKDRDKININLMTNSVQMLNYLVFVSLDRVLNVKLF